MTGGRRWGVLLLCVFLVQAGSVARAADPLLTEDPTAQDVVAYAGQVAWTRQGADKHFRIVLHTATGNSDVPVSPFAAAPHVTFGPGQDGHPTLVYLRATGIGVQLYEFDTTTGIETPAPVPQPPKGCAVIGAVHERLVAYAFVRVGSACREVVRVRTATRTVFARQIPDVWKIALGSRHLAVVHGDLDLRLHAYDLTSRRARLLMREDASAYGGAGSITAPVFDASDTLYFAATEINASGTYGSTIGPYRVRLTSHPTCAMSRRRFGANVLLRSLSIDPPNAFYADDQHLHQTPLAGLHFGRSSRLPC